MRISDWSSDVCSSDLQPPDPLRCSFFNGVRTAARPDQDISMSVISKAASAAAILYGLSAANVFAQDTQVLPSIEIDSDDLPTRSEEHTSELQSLMRISYAVFCLKKKNINPQTLK